MTYEEFQGLARHDRIAACLSDLALVALTQTPVSATELGQNAETENTGALRAFGEDSTPYDPGGQG